MPKTMSGILQSRKQITAVLIGKYQHKLRYKTTIVYHLLKASNSVLQVNTIHRRFYTPYKHSKLE